MMGIANNSTTIISILTKNNFKVLIVLNLNIYKVYL
jgi:hypothetical protein